MQDDIGEGDIYQMFINNRIPTDIFPASGLLDSEERIIVNLIL